MTFVPGILHFEIMTLKHGAVTDKIIAAFLKVYRFFGYGFAEKVYENALAFELRQMGLKVNQQIAIDVFYGNQLVGSYIADVIVDDKVIIELKAVKTIVEQHEAQLLNYLKATQYEVGLLLNFGEKPDFKRKVFDNPLKGNTGWLKPTSEILSSV